MSEITRSDLATLYKAQETANQVNYPDIFPCYSKEHLKEQTGFSAVWKNSYQVIYDIFSCFSPVVAAISWVANKIFEGLDKLFSVALNSAMPINPVNGKRHFICFPKTWEIGFGKAIYNSVTSGFSDVDETVMVAGKPMGKMIHDVFHKLADDNPEVLNPDKDHPFEYHVRTVNSDQVNAFAVMGGGMLVHSQIVKMAAEAIEGHKYDDVEVEFADGTVASVDMRGVTVEDTMAALMGHEMTHVASRHSVFSIIGNIFRFVAVWIGSIFVTVKLKSGDAEYQELKNKKVSDMTGAEYQRLMQKERSYAAIQETVQWLGNKVGALFGLYYSRKNEYEADITGLHLMHNAGFDARGAIMLQHILLKAHGDSAMSEFQRKYEWLFTHPHSSNRKRGALAALSVVNSDLVKKHVTWTAPKAVCKFDTKRSDPSITFAPKLMSDLQAVTT